MWCPIVELRASGLITSTLSLPAITQTDAKLKAEGWLSVAVVAQSQSVSRLIRPHRGPGFSFRRHYIPFFPALCRFKDSKDPD